MKEDLYERMKAWLLKNGNDVHAYDCGYRYITLDGSCNPPKAEHCACTCGLAEILRDLKELEQPLKPEPMGSRLGKERQV